MHSVKVLWVLVGVVVLTATFVAGFGVGAKMPGIKLSDDYQAGWNAARDAINNSHLLPPEPDTLTSIGGRVAAVSKDTLTIDANPVSVNPLNDRGPATREVKITDKTKIFKNVALTDKEFQDGMKKFNEDSAAGKNVQPPMPFKQVEAKAGDIKEGQTISVASDTDIKTVTSITATSIIIAP